MTLTGNQPHAQLLGDVFPGVTLPTHGSVIAVAKNGRKIAGTTFVFNLMRQPSMARAQPIPD
ncbi:hypothetical protein [Sulfidibacter corallicola]|uniref:Uncharacterized protein n=1 Tax=Sulfidibacter corallicola TaxID=2818388 RepID=A0A8A4TY34_SULCO|nr:hypothetical protein [Sulfidibacter corallicola]QTD54247.1 hypothetical protein J3U87_17520 [Sulfidibacter corallicola]